MKESRNKQQLGKYQNSPLLKMKTDKSLKIVPFLQNDSFVMMKLISIRLISMRLNIISVCGAQKNNSFDNSRK